MVRRVVLTSGIRDGCGSLYRATSAKAVTRRCPPEGFLTRNEGFRYSTVMPRSSGRPWPVQVHRTLLAALQVGCASTALRLLYWANVYSSLNGVKDAVVLLQQLLKFEAGLIW